MCSRSLSAPGTSPGPKGANFGPGPSGITRLSPAPARSMSPVTPVPRHDPGLGASIRKAGGRPAEDRKDRSMENRSRLSTYLVTALAAALALAAAIIPALAAAGS